MTWNNDFYVDIGANEFFMTNYANDQLEFALDTRYYQDYKPLVEPMPIFESEPSLKPLVLAKRYKQKANSDWIYEEYPPRRYN